MTEQPLQELAKACVIIGGAVCESLAAAREMLDSLTAAFAAVEAKAMGIQTDDLQEDERDPIEELLRDIEEKRTMYDLADMAEEPADIEIPKKAPRPPKRLGPVNKANYTANRPPRRARSSCYIRRH